MCAFFNLAQAKMKSASLGEREKKGFWLKIAPACWKLSFSPRFHSHAMALRSEMVKVDLKIVELYTGNNLD